MAARLAAARRSWGWLVSTLAQWGWHDRATRLLLGDTYVHSVLLFGAAVWGPDMVDPGGNIARDRTGQLGSFYHTILCSSLGLPRTMCNEVLFVLSGRFPLSLYIGKVLIRYEASLVQSDRLVARAVRAVCHSESDGH